MHLVASAADHLAPAYSTACHQCCCQPPVSSTPKASGDDERKSILELLQSVSRTMDRIATPGTPQVDHILDMRDTIEYNYIVHDNKLNQ